MATNMKARLGKIAKKRPKKKPLVYVAKDGVVRACAARKKTPKKTHSDLGFKVSAEWLKHRKQMHCILFVSKAGVVHARPNAIGVKRGLVRKSGTLTGKHFKKGATKKRGRPSKQKASKGRKKTAKAKKKATKKVAGKGKKKCTICKKGMRQKKGRGRPRLKHATC